MVTENTLVGYPLGYKPNLHERIPIILADLKKQIRQIHGWFNCGTKFNADWVVRSHPFLPDRVEKFFAIPWQSIAPTYNEEVDLVLQKIKDSCKSGFCNHREEQFGPNQLREHTKTVSLFQELRNQQKKQDILVVPAQLGICYRNIPMNTVRQIMKPNECGLGILTIGMMILTHPERFTENHDLWIDCCGDEFSSSADGIFSSSPCLGLDNNQLALFVRTLFTKQGFCGSASAYLPQG